jgi:predicted acylesterase/phospholipase RssA
MQYDLVFEGGGAKGMVFIGALQELERRGHTYGRLLGTSAGSIVATFTAAGYDVTEMLEALSEKDAVGTPVFKTFLGKPPAFPPEEVENSTIRNVLELITLSYIPDLIESRFDRFILDLLSREQFSNIFSFLERGGWYTADNLLAWARRKLDSGTFNGKPRQMSGLTLGEFYDVTGTELSLIAADTTSYRKFVLNHNTSPDLPIVWAMRMSMSVPLVWQEVVWKPEWGTYMGHDVAGHRIVDGGLLSNFPIQLFISNSKYVTDIMGPKISPGVLGLLIDEKLVVPGMEPPTPEPDELQLTTLPLTSRIMNLINTVTKAHDKMLIDAYEQFVCRLPAKGYGTMEFDMSDARRDALIEGGRQALDAYFQKQEIHGLLDLNAPDTANRQANQLAEKDLIN